MINNNVVVDLRICKYCLCYILVREQICPFCGVDPDIKSAEYIRRGYDGQVAYRRLSALVASLFQR